MTMAVRGKTKKYDDSVKKGSNTKMIIALFITIIAVLVILLFVVFPLLANMWFQGVFGSSLPVTQESIEEAMNDKTQIAEITLAACSGERLYVNVKATGSPIQKNVTMFYLDSELLGLNNIVIPSGRQYSFNFDLGRNCSGGLVKVTSPGNQDGDLYQLG